MSGPQTDSNDTSNDPKFFLPDFCTPIMLLQVAIAAQLLAVVLILSPVGGNQYEWADLGIISMFVQSIALSSAIALCVLRPVLSRFPPLPGLLLSCVVIALMAATISEIAWRFVLSTMVSEMYARGTISHALFIANNIAITLIIGLLALRYFHMQQQWRLLLESEAQARIQALQSRINPHFLFNSMNTIAMLTRADPEQAERAIEDLSTLFRAALMNADQRITLEDELTLCEHYLRIEGWRFGERLQVEWTTDTLPRDALVPSLCLQPVLENAIRHGIQLIPEGGLIRVTGLIDDGRIKIEVENSLPPEGIVSHDGHHIGQDNLRRRLSAYFGREGQLDSARQSDCYRVSLRFPYEQRQALDD